MPMLNQGRSFNNVWFSFHVLASMSYTAFTAQLCVFIGICTVISYEIGKLARIVWGLSINYVSTFEGGGVSGMLTFADMGEGGDIKYADVSIFILKNNEKLRPTTASDVQLRSCCNFFLFCAIKQCHHVIGFFICFKSRYIHSVPSHQKRCKN